MSTAEKMIVLTESFGEKFKVVGVAPLSLRELADKWRKFDEVNRDLWEVDVLT
jgi:hypothetical protein